MGLVSSSYLPRQHQWSQNHFLDSAMGFKGVANYCGAQLGMRERSCLACQLRVLHAAANALQMLAIIAEW